MLTVDNDKRIQASMSMAPHTRSIEEEAPTTRVYHFLGQSQLQNVLDSLHFQKVIFLFTFEYWKAKLYVSNPSFYVIGLAFYASVDI